MALNETVVEVVKFQEAGISAIAARTRAMAAEADEAQKKYRTLLAVVSDRRYNAHQRNVEDLRRKYEAVSLNARNYALQQRVADGSAAKHLATVTKLNKQHELMQMRVRNAAAAQGLADGSTVKQLRETARLNEEYEQIQRKAELIARYGERWGGFLAKYGGLLKTAGRVGGLMAAAGIATGVSLYHTGMQNTVEGNLAAHEWKLLGREVAGIFRPVSDTTTKLTKRFREFLATLDTSGQDRMMYAGLGAMGLSAAWGLRSFVTGGIVSRMLGFGGASAAGAGAAGAAAAGAGGAAGAGAAGAGAAAGAAAGAGASRLKWLARGGVVAVPAAAAAGAPYERPGERPSEYFSRLRAGGDSVAEALFWTGGRAIGKTLGLTSGPRTEEEERREREGRRSVTPAGFGFDAPGTGYDRIAAAVSSIEANRDTETGGGVSVLLNRIHETLEAMREEARRSGGPGLARPGG